MLQAGDVLTHVGGHEVADDGTFHFAQVSHKRPCRVYVISGQHVVGSGLWALTQHQPYIVSVAVSYSPRVASWLQLGLICCLICLLGYSLI